MIVLVDSSLVCTIGHHVGWSDIRVAQKYVDMRGMGKTVVIDIGYISFYDARNHSLVASYLCGRAGARRCYPRDLSLKDEV